MHLKADTTFIPGKESASQTCTLAPERSGTGLIWFCWSCTLTVLLDGALSALAACLKPS